ncbi:MAG: GTPase ObgE [Acidobacteria bacterium]|nr:GTPase ObgE [Acidobacteriota bacterium]
MFVDSARIFVKSGRGGAGAVSFRREKYVPKGGPDGGDGGRGGSVYLVGKQSLRTLLSFKYKKKFVAENGRPGEGSLKSGSSGKDLIIYVPLGTIVYIEGREEPVADITEAKQKVLIAKGGRGGKGNAHFKSATHQAPRFAQKGEDGEEFFLHLELKLLADVGLVGMPNAGKSTLLAALTKAKPKIAPYPFTTLSPNLGVVEGEKHNSFVIADIPGLIEGAHQGAGLGDEFLKHIERTRVLLHLVDLSDETATPLERFKIIQKEMEMYQRNLLSKPMIVVGTKIDIPYDLEKEAELSNYLNKSKSPYFRISAAAHKGLKPLLKEIWSFFEDE